MAKVACGSCGRSPSRPTRTGSSSIATSTWTICASTRRRHYDVRPDPDPVQPSTVLALSRTLRAGSAGAAAFAAASLTAAARGALPEGRSGRRDGRFRSNKGMLLIDLNEPHHPRHDQLLNLTHTTPQQERTKPSGPRPCRYGAKLPPQRELTYQEMCYVVIQAKGLS